MSVSLSYLTTLFPSSSGAGASLLNALYGGGGAGGASGQNPIQALASAERNQTAEVKQTAQQTDVKTVMAAFTKAVGKAKSVKDLLANPAVMNVLLTANGMADQIGYTALATKVLTSNLKDPNSLANTLGDSRWKTLAQTYDFATNGLKAIQNPKVLAAIASGYAQITWENAQDSVTPGISNALAFKAQAGTVKSVDDILGNPTLRTVVTTALGIPQQIAFQSLTTQERVIKNGLDIRDLKDPKFVERFVQRYLIANSNNSSSY